MAVSNVLLVAGVESRMHACLLCSRSFSAPCMHMHACQCLHMELLVGIPEYGAASLSHSLFRGKDHVRVLCNVL